MTKNNNHRSAQGQHDSGKSSDHSMLKAAFAILILVAILLVAIFVTSSLFEA